jgi:hypothetical protein
MPIDERIIPALQASHEHENADVLFLCSQLNLDPDAPCVRANIESFRRQIWHVAAERGFEAAKT